MILQLRRAQTLLYELQQLDGVATSASPTIDYEWAFAGAADGNYNRLVRMIYPTRISGGRRQINLGYATGTNGAGVDSALGRITSITDQTTNASTSYTYGGMSRRLSLLLACGIAQSFAASGGTVGATGLDRFGRPADLHYIGATAPLPGLPAGTVHRYEYRYDASGNRTHARVVQAPPNWNGGGGGTGTNRSWAYGYDALQRLTAADRGIATAGGNPGDPIPLATTDVATDWNLDNLGNWTGVFDPDPPPGADIPGMTITYAPGAANEIVDSRSHSVFFDNSLESVKTQHGAANPVETAYVVNLVGSTVFDGVYYYEYDAWNRLIRVSDAGTVTAASFDADGVLLPPAPPPTGSGPDVNVPGDWRVRYTYDGLGRLARKETPVTSSGTEARREDYRYDGVRRIQEAVTRWSGAVVIPGGEEQGASGGTNPGEPGAGDPGAITLGGLEEPVEATPLEPFGEGTLLLALPEEWDQREYVWGPDYVDELAFQFDRDGRPLYALLDANYNVMAIVAGGVRPCGNIDADPYDDTVPAGTVLEQYVWSPYGELLALDLLIPLAKGESPRNRAGHQGLFFERFDGKNTDPPLVATDPITGEGKGWYYNRNRWYDATMGRFTTADPNGSAIATLNNDTRLGIPFRFTISVYIDSQFEDGHNLTTSTQSNPLRHQDPLGLFTLAEVGGASMLGINLDAQTADIGVSFFGAVRGLTTLTEAKYAMMSGLIDAAIENPNLDGIDAALGVYERFQEAQATLVSVGLFKAGASIAIMGVGAAMKAVLKIRHRHHPIPKFMGGYAKRQFLYSVPAYIHVNYHRQLNRVLRANGFPPMNRKFKAFLQNNPGAQERAFEIVERFSRNYDRHNNTRFTMYFMDNLIAGRFDEY